MKADCINWSGGKLPKGYGITSWKGKRCLAHRLAYCKHNDVTLESIKGLVVRHECDNPSCINPDHLLIGTLADNNRDMVERGRQARVRGERNARTKLTDAQVSEIKSIYVQGSREFGGPSLARRYGVKPQTIIKIVLNQRRSPIDVPPTLDAATILRHHAVLARERAERKTDLEPIALHRAIVERVRYEDGMLFWVKSSVKSNIGKLVGKLDKHGYLRLHPARGKMVSVHRLIFFMFHGWLPEIVDHRDGNRQNNCIENLRAATACENMRNVKLSARNKSGVKGVRQSGDKWIAIIRVNKRLKHLGTFPDKFEAICARKSAERIHYGEFAR